MPQPTAIPDETHATAGPRGEVGKVARHQAAITRAGRRLLIVVALGDMAMTLTEAVHERALAEEAAAKAALLVRETAEAEPDREAPVPSETIPSQPAPAQPAQSGEQTRAAPRARVRAGPRAAVPAPAMTAGALFARLSDIVRQCLELEIRIDEDLRRLELAVFVPLQPDATLGDPIEVSGHAGAPHHDAVSAASLCRDLGLHPNPARWRPAPDP